MTFIKKPIFRHPSLPTNSIGLTYRDYEGLVSTLCAGCGHDSITASIIDACYELSLPAHKIAKLSGIGCSSKTPNYFLNNAHGFNSVHGRMPSVATGANLANRDLVYIGVSGDGDTASIGLGQYCHAIRRQLNLTYICENNGTYGLTKGQFSATNDKKSKNKRGQDNPFGAIDLASIAIELGAGFVARSFSGDKEQIVPLIKAAIAYDGFAFLDIISPCVTFNNHVSSTKSYDYVREHRSLFGDLDFVPEEKNIEAKYSEGETISLTLHNGSEINFKKLGEDHDPTDQDQVVNTLREDRKEGKVTTGLLYIDPDKVDLHKTLNTSEKPLNSIPMDDLCPGKNQIDAINKQFK
tara:strand:+ start:13897 stop:14952 length:1056 start_codon:yes stop_codon:yes gene_type:complete